MKDHLESSIFGDHDEDHLDEHHDDHHDDQFEDRLHDLQARESHEPVGPAHAAYHPAGPSDAPVGERASGRGRKRRRRAPVAGGSKPPVWRRLLVIVLALAVIVGGLAVAYTALRPVVEGLMESNDYPGPGDGKVRITVEEGAGGSAIARELVDRDVIKSSKAFVYAATADPRSTSIQPGVYNLKTQMK